MFMLYILDIYVDLRVYLSPGISQFGLATPSEDEEIWNRAYFTVLKMQNE